MLLFTSNTQYIKSTYLQQLLSCGCGASWDCCTNACIIKILEVKS